MVSLIKPGSVKILTKEGEIQVSLTLDININLNTDGVSLNKNNEVQIEEKFLKKEEKFDWAIPDFDIPSSKIKFGKKEN